MNDRERWPAVVDSSTRKRIRPFLDIGSLTPGRGLCNAPVHPTGYGGESCHALLLFLSCTLYEAGEKIVEYISSKSVLNFCIKLISAESPSVLHLYINLRCGFYESKCNAM